MNARATFPAANDDPGTPSPAILELAKALARMMADDEDRADRSQVEELCP